MKKHLLLFIVACSAWQCHSESVPTPISVPSQTKTEMLTGKDWKLTAATVNPAYDYFGQQRRINDIYALLAFCVKDDIFHYATHNVFTISDGQMSCGGIVTAGTFNKFNATV